MPKSYVEKVGNRNECTAVDPEQVMNSLNKGNFELSTSANTYSPEEYTTSYISSIFNAINKIEESWKKCKNTAGNYISGFEDVPLPDDLPTIPKDFEDEPEEVVAPQVTNSLGVASVTATALKIRKDSNMDSQVVGYCGNGDKFEVVGYSENGKWLEVKLPDGSKGYISKKYTSVVENPHPVETKTEEIETLEEPPKSQKVSDTNSKSSNSDKNSSSPKVKKEDIEMLEEIPKVEKKSNSDVTAPKKSSLRLGVVSTKNKNLNIRTAPGLDSQVIGSLPRNAEVEVLEYNDNSKWAKISYNGEERYVYKDLIKLKGE